MRGKEADLCSFIWLVGGGDMGQEGGERMGRVCKSGREDREKGVQGMRDGGGGSRGGCSVIRVDVVVMVVVVGVWEGWGERGVCGCWSLSDTRTRPFRRFLLSLITGVRGEGEGYMRDEGGGTWEARDGEGGLCGWTKLREETEAVAGVCVFDEERTRDCGRVLKGEGGPQQGPVGTHSVNCKVHGGVVYL